jgi:hypothetical protein
MTVRAESTSVHAPSEPLVVDAGTEDLMIPLRAGCSIHGWITNSRGEPIQTQLQLSLSDDPSAPSRKLYMEKAGEFEFRGLLPGRYALASSWSQQEIAILDGLIVEGSDRPTEVTLRTRPAELIRVRYNTGNKSGRLEFDHDGVRIMEMSVSAGSSGWFCVPPGRVDVRLRATPGPDVLEETFDLPAGGTSGVRFDLRQR